MQKLPSSASASPLISTQNPAWGFYGTSLRDYRLSDADCALLFDHVARLLISGGVVADAAAAVEALDSTVGRHFSDALSFEVSVGATVDQLKAAALTELGIAKKGWVGCFRKVLTA